MDFGEQLNKEILEMMEALKKDSNLRLKNQTHFLYSIYPTEIEVNDFISAQNANVIADHNRKVLLKLADLCVIEAKHDEEAIETTDYSYLVKLNDKKFEEVYENLKVKSQKGQRRSEATNHLFVDENGNFWAEPKELLCYPMDKESARLKILLYLVDNNNFQSTESIAKHLGDKDNQGIRTEIGKMRINIKKFLRLDNVIESKKDSGYRINPAYKVIKHQNQ